MTWCMKSQKKSHWTMRANYVYILSRQKLLKNGAFWWVFENLKLTVKQCYQTGKFEKDNYWWYMRKLKHSNETFWVSFKHCAKCKIETFLTLCLNLILKNSSWILKMKSFTDLFTKSSVQNVNNLFTSFFQKVFAVNFVACFFTHFVQCQGQKWR